MLLPAAAAWQRSSSAGGLSLFKLSSCDSLITCCAWDTSGASASALPAAAELAGSMALMLPQGPCTTGVPHELPAPPAGPAEPAELAGSMALAPADMALGSPDESALASAGLADSMLDLPVPLDISARELSHSMAQQEPALQSVQGRHSAVLVYGCEDGTVWRVGVVWAHDGGSLPAMKTELCYEAVSLLACYFPSVPAALKTA